MLILFETPAGFALFSVNDAGKLKDVDKVYEQFKTADSARSFVSLRDFHKFASTTDALSAAAALNDGKMDSSLKKFLRKSIVKKDVSDTLAVIDSKLAGTINEKLSIKCSSGPLVTELMRGVRSQLDNLLTGINKGDMGAMVLGLAHSLSRYKIKFSPDKVDTMIVQAIGLLDDLDKELNTYSMRIKEWYGWHFPEMGKIVVDNLMYARTVKTMGVRSSNIADLSGVLPDELEQQVKEAAQISMGTEISEDDITNITELCDQVIEMTEYREQLYDYLKNRMQAIAPNLTVLVGELVGARLIAHAGSLLNLAKHPASTVQILGAEKALFRALKTKHATPKYGLIYHASLVGQASAKNKGKMSRVLANKCALSIRVDALGDQDTKMIGAENRLKVEQRLQELEGRAVRPEGERKSKKLAKYEGARNEAMPNAPATASTYNDGGDVQMAEAGESKAERKAGKKRRRSEVDDHEEAPAAKAKKEKSEADVATTHKEKKSKKEKKEKKEKKSKKEKKEKKEKKSKKEKKEKKEKKKSKKD